MSSRPLYKYEVVLWYSLIAKGSLNLIKQYIIGIFDACMTRPDNPAHSGHDTMKEVWEVLVWGFKALYAGEWPQEDHEGKTYRKGSAESNLNRIVRFLAGDDTDTSFFLCDMVVEGRLGLSYEGVVFTKLQRKSTV